eukprot:376300-Hanusia_phi.AAC.1
MEPGPGPGVRPAGTQLPGTCQCGSLPSEVEAADDSPSRRPTVLDPARLSLSPGRADHAAARRRRGARRARRPLRPRGK